jgi:hypothetical protein
MGCSDPVHTTGPVSPEVETLAVGAVAAVSPAGFALAQATRAIRDAGRHTSLSFIEILYLKCGVESSGLSNTVSTGMFRCQWNGGRLGNHSGVRAYLINEDHAVSEVLDERCYRSIS